MQLPLLPQAGQLLLLNVNTGADTSAGIKYKYSLLADVQDL